MNPGPGASKLGWVSVPPLPTYVEYQTSDKRNRNPNWTDSEITRFLGILMEEPVLSDLNAQRNKQVFCYVSRKMAGEGSEKTWDQCRVKLKNLKSQWRYVKDRIPGIEEADLDDEDVVRQLMQECQARGVSPSCIKHLRLLKQFLMSLAAVKKGMSPPRYRSETTVNYTAMEAEHRLSALGGGRGSMCSPLADSIYKSSLSMSPCLKVEHVDSLHEQDFDEADARLVVEAGISPPSSPATPTPMSAASLAILGSPAEEMRPATGLRVMSPTDINSATRKRPALDQADNPGHLKRALLVDPIDGREGQPEGEEDDTKDSNVSTAAILQKFQRDMMDKFLQFQRESEVRFLSWEQERWRMEQNLLDRWRNDQRSHEKEIFSMFANLLSQCSQTILDNKHT